MLRYASLKLMPRFGNPSVTGPEFRDKCKRGRPKHECRRPKRERERYVSKAALHFENLCVYDPSALRKKPSVSSEKNFPILGRSLPICGRSLPVCGGDAPQMHFRKVLRIATSILKTRTISCTLAPTGETHPPPLLHLFH